MLKIVSDYNKLHIPTFSLEVGTKWIAYYHYHKDQSGILDNWCTENLKGLLYVQAYNKPLQNASNVLFTNEDDRLLFKLAFYEPKEYFDIDTASIGALNKVILPVLRRVMPSVLAQNIIGVQPMTNIVKKDDQS